MAKVAIPDINMEKAKEKIKTVIEKCPGNAIFIKWKIRKNKKQQVESQIGIKMLTFHLCNLSELCRYTGNSKTGHEAVRIRKKQ